MYRAVYQREPTAEQLAAAVAMARGASGPAEEALRLELVNAWSYGYGSYDSDAQRVSSFEALPHFTGDAWQGGGDWPDASLGWLRLTAEGGHPGKDHAHAVIRRWRAPRPMTIRLVSTLVHERSEGDGVRAFVVSDRSGEVATGAAQESRGAGAIALPFVPQAVQLIELHGDAVGIGTELLPLLSDGGDTFPGSR